MSEQEHTQRPSHLAPVCAGHPITLVTLWLGLPMVGMVLFGTGLLVGHWWRSPVPPEPREHLRMSVGAGLPTLANPQHASSLSAATAEPVPSSPEQQGTAAPTDSASVSSVSATAPPQSIAPLFEPDVEGWDVIKESKTPHDFVEFLTAFPASRLAPQALQHLCQLHALPQALPPGADHGKMPAPHQARMPRQTQLPPPPQVSPLQLRYAQLGLHRAGVAPGSIDGRWGPRTVTALRQYQARHGLLVTGTLDAPTQAALQIPSHDALEAWHQHGRLTRDIPVTMAPPLVRVHAKQRLPDPSISSRAAPTLATPVPRLSAMEPP